MRYSEATKENFDDKTKQAVETAINEDKGLFIYGDTGTGKTYILHALGRGKGGVENFVELLVEFRDDMQKGFYHEKLVDFTKQDYLFIDDIGSEKTSEFVIEFLYMVVNKRYENMKRTVFATNLTLEDFKTRYGDRILSRIAEMCVLLELKGEDKRL